MKCLWSLLCPVMPCAITLCYSFILTFHCQLCCFTAIPHPSLLSPHVCIYATHHCYSWGSYSVVWQQALVPVVFTSKDGYPFILLSLVHYSTCTYLLHFATPFLSHVYFTSISICFTLLWSAVVLWNPGHPWKQTRGATLLGKWLKPRLLSSHYSHGVCPKPPQIITLSPVLLADPAVLSCTPSPCLNHNKAPTTSQNCDAYKALQKSWNTHKITLWTSIHLHTPCAHTAMCTNTLCLNIYRHLPSAWDFLICPWAQCRHDRWLQWGP